MQTDKRIYLAGPDVFHPEAIAIGEAKKNMCTRYGFEGVSPVDAEIDLRGLSKKAAGLRIGAENERLIRSCGIMIANLTPFRGPSADVGTAYEMGVGSALGLKVFAYTNDSRTYFSRAHAFVATQLGSHVYGVRDEGQWTVEDFDMIDNLMLESCVERTGGGMTVPLDDTPIPFSNLSQFERCLAKLSGLVI